MAQHPKAKPKRKSSRNTDKKQSARFIEAARKLGADESGKEFENVLKKIVPPKIGATGKG
jgi:hypothetical protein